MSQDNDTTFVDPREIHGWPGYRVWPNGRVQSCRRRGSGSRWLSDHWHDLKPGFTKGRANVVLQCGGISGHIRTFSVSHLVLEAFVGPRPPGYEACHNDGDPKNNHYSNLRWDTTKGNAADRAKHGTHLQGSRVATAKLTEAQVIEIRKCHIRGESQLSLARKNGVHVKAIRRILSRETWKHV